MRKAVFVLALILSAASLACAQGDPGAAPAAPDTAATGESPAGGEGIEVQVASYDLAAGREVRVIAGLITKDQMLVSYGTVDMEFFYAGPTEPEGQVTLSPGPAATGRFLPIEGSPQEQKPAPMVGTPSDGRGVYAAQVEFPQAGYWVLQVKAQLQEGTTLVGKGTFEVLDEPKVPAVGEPAPRTENLTAASTDAPTAAVDSRADKLEELPDPELHDRTVAGVVKEKRPALVVISTPVYCVSRFCGPVTDLVQDLASRYRKTEFIHIEVWRDFENQVLNKGAAEWIYRDEDLHEPWVFLIGDDGRILARWDNVATRGEIEPLLTRIERDKARG